MRHWKGIGAGLAGLAGLWVASVAAAQTPPAQNGRPAQPERRICRMMGEPGALAGSRRVCMTRAEWDRAAAEARREGEQMRDGADSCGLRSQGGTQIDTTAGVGQQQAAAMARMSGC